MCSCKIQWDMKRLGMRIQSQRIGMRRFQSKGLGFKWATLDVVCRGELKSAMQHIRIRNASSVLKGNEQCNQHDVWISIMQQ